MMVATVTGTMLITSIAFSTVVVRLWNYPFWVGATILTLLMSIEFPFFFSSLTKFAHGAWFPLLIASALVAIMLTWHRGRALIRRKMLSTRCSLQELANIMEKKSFSSPPGTDVVITFNPDPCYAAAHAFEWLRLNDTLRQQLLLLTPVGTAESHVDVEKKLEVIPLSPSLCHVIFYYGYMQEINLPQILRLAAPQLPFKIEMEQTFFLLTKETIIEYSNKEMKRWQRSLFAWLSRNMTYAPDYFFIPCSQIIDFTWIMKV